MALSTIERRGINLARKTVNSSLERTFTITTYPFLGEIFKRSPLRNELSKQELIKLTKVCRKILRGEPVQASQEAAGIFESSKEKVFFHGKENIPVEGPTLVIGNHIRGGPFFDMGQFFLMAKVIYNARTQVPEEIREPFLIMQDRLTNNLLFEFLSKIVYKNAAKSFGWQTILPPIFDENGQVVNDQKIGHSILRRLKNGEAMYCFPQGRHVEPDNFFFPDRAGQLLETINKFVPDTLVVPLRATPQDGALHFYFGQSIPISYLAEQDNKIDINRFAKEHITTLGPKTVFVT